VADENAGVVEQTYQRIKARSVAFMFKPGERINEGALAKDLGVSRTPLREALNRLVAEQMIDFVSGKGFFCRELDPRKIYELYEMREILEEAAVRRACQRATDAELEALKAELYENGLAYVGKTIREVTSLDEAFHIGIARLSGNGELLRSLEQINERIRFIRWVDMSARAPNTKGEHKLIMAALEQRDADLAASHMRAHIEKRMDQVVVAVKEGVSNLYLTGPEEIFGRRLEAAEFD